MKRIYILFFLITLKQVNAQVCFNPGLDFDSYWGYSARPCAADFNSDGKLDIAIVSIGQVGSVILGTGTGFFQTPTTFSTIGYSPNYVISADFNGDSKADLATTTNSLVEVFLGNGTGSFSIPTNTVLLNNTPWFNNYSFPESVDLNLDGKIDLLVLDYQLNTVSVLIGSGTGNFSAPVNYTVGLLPSDILCADFNGDGNPDVATSNNSSNDISILFGNGIGGFSSITSFSSTPGIRRIQAADFNSDAKVDIIGTDILNNVFLLFGNGAGAFAPVTNFSVAGISNIFDIKQADFNNDGKIDIAFADFSADKIGVILGSGSGTFSPFFSYGFATDPRGITSGDFNGDLKIDLVTSNDNTTSVTYFQNCTSTGVKDLEVAKSLSLFPNPVTNFLHLSGEQYFEVGTEIEITNLLGETVLKQGFKREIDLTELLSGYYTLKVVNQNSQPFISKFIKN